MVKESAIFFLRSIDKLIASVSTLFVRIFPPKKEQGGEIKKILLVKFWGLGNLVIIFSLIDKIKEKYPESQIFFLTFDLNRDLIQVNSKIEKIFYFKYTQNIFRIIPQFFSLVGRIRRERFDAIFNFETFNFLSSALSYFSSAGLRAGINNKSEKIFYNFWVDNDPYLHISSIFSRLLTAVDINHRYEYYRFEESASARTNIEGVLNGFRIMDFICIHPGTSRNYIGKRWSQSSYAALADLLVKYYRTPVLFIGNERELIAEIVAKSSFKESIFDFSGMFKIEELIELIRKSSLFISNDTGPAHIAYALKINTVSLFGPTTPKKYGPLHSNSLVFYRGLKCSPCIGIDYLNRKCRNSFACLDFSAGEVFTKISQEFPPGRILKNTVESQR